MVERMDEMKSEKIDGKKNEGSSCEGRRGKLNFRCVGATAIPNFAGAKWCVERARRRTRTRTRALSLPLLLPPTSRVPRKQRKQGTEKRREGVFVTPAPRVREGEEAKETELPKTLPFFKQFSHDGKLQTFSSL